MGKLEQITANFVKNPVDSVKYALTRQIVIDILVIIGLILVVLTNDLFVLLIIALIAVIELPYIRRNSYRELRKNLFVYLIPVLYLANLYRLNDYNQDNLWSAVASMIMIISFIAYDAIARKLTNRQIIAYGINKKYDKANRILNGEPSYIWFYAALVAAGINLYVPRLAGVVFLVVIVLVLVNVVRLFMIKLYSKDSDESNLQDIVDYQPQFIVYFSVGQNSQSAYMMWDKYLKKVNERFIILTPQKHHIDPLRKLTNVPVVYCNGARNLERIVETDSVGAVFYTANSPSNMLVMTVFKPQHVLLLHGDSDKASSYRLVTGAYDKAFVAGQAAIDRYKDHGVNIAPDKFVVVGRPQVEDIEPARNHIKTALYAPTWHGNVAQMDYSSLYKGPEIVQKLLDNGLRVIFRPHPHSVTSSVLSKAMDQIYAMLERDNRKTGLNHLYGDQAERIMDVNDCFNQSDLMVSDVSSVISDYLYSEKPMILVSMRDSAEEFVKQYPTSAAGYVVEKDLVGMSETITDLMGGKDDLASKRNSLKEHYLSKAPEGRSYSELFVSNVKKVLNTPTNRG